MAQPTKNTSVRIFSLPFILLAINIYMKELYEIG